MPTSVPKRSSLSLPHAGRNRPTDRPRSWPRRLAASSVSSCTRGPWSGICRGWEKNAAARRPAIVDNRTFRVGRTLREYQAGRGERPGVVVLRIGYASPPGSFRLARLCAAASGKLSPGVCVGRSGGIVLLSSDVHRFRASSAGSGLYFGFRCFPLSRRCRMIPTDRIRRRHNSVSRFPLTCLNSRVPCSVSTSRSSNRTGGFTASGSRTRLMVSPTGDDAEGDSGSAAEAYAPDSCQETGWFPSPLLVLPT